MPTLSVHFPLQKFCNASDWSCFSAVFRAKAYIRSRAAGSRAFTLTLSDESCIWQDNPGGETQDTKRGSGKLDFFGGSDSGDAQKSAEKNIEKAKSLETFAKPGSAKVVRPLLPNPPALSP